jgi:polar amino acid transport system substrate-binding protein
MMLRRRAWLQLVVVALVFLAGCGGVATSPDRSAVQALAPSGKLRVGLYPGTPTSIIGDAGSGNARGVGYDLGRALAQRAGVPFEPVVFPNNAAVQAAARAGQVDMVFTNATPARMNDLDFSPVVLQTEQGYLVPRGSPMRAIEDADREGARIGVSEGSTSEATLSRTLKQAKVVRTASLKTAVELLASGQLEAFATNKATLFEMSDDLPGSQVLPGRWGLESLAIGIPKRREAAQPLIATFVREAQASGAVRAAVARAGLRGAVVPD